MHLLTLMTLVLLISRSCHAFHSCVPSFTSKNSGIKPHRHDQCLRKRTHTRMSYWDHGDAVALAEALNQATQVLVDATDASRGGAVVEQIPYLPGDASEIPDFSKIIIGSAACVLAYAWAAYEFGSRIVTQRACAICGGSGLVNSTRSGRKLTQPRKCYACGGFLPWENWGRFWQTNMDVGNGGVLQRPASDYDELNKAATAGKEAERAGSNQD